MTNHDVLIAALASAGVDLTGLHEALSGYVPAAGWVPAGEGRWTRQHNDGTTAYLLDDGAGRRLELHVDEHTATLHTYVGESAQLPAHPLDGYTGQSSVELKELADIAAERAWSVLARRAGR